MNISPEEAKSKPKFSIGTIIGALIIACGGFLIAFLALHLFYVKKFPRTEAVLGFAAMCGAIFFLTFGSLYLFLLPSLRRSDQKTALIVSSESRHILALSNILADNQIVVTTTALSSARAILRAARFDYVFISPADAVQLRFPKTTKLVMCVRKSEANQTQLYSHGRMNDVLVKPVAPGAVAEILGPNGSGQGRATGD